MRFLLRPLLFTLLTTIPLCAAEVILQNGANGYQGASDTTLNGTNENQASFNYGHDEKLSVAGVAHGGMKQLGLIRFGDLTGPGALPVGARVSRAMLELYKVGEPTDKGQYQKVAAKDLVINGYRMLKGWQAGDMRGEVSEGAATFAYRAYKSDVPEFWGDSNQIEQGPVKGVDYDTTGATKAAMLVGVKDAWMQFDVTGLVQKWLDEPEANYGVLLSARSFYIGSFFASCEASETEFRPKLVIEY